MKKLSAIALALVLLCTVFTGCANVDNGSDGSIGDNSGTVPTAIPGTQTPESSDMPESESPASSQTITP